MEKERVIEAVAKLRQNQKLALLNLLYVSVARPVVIPSLFMIFVGYRFYKHHESMKQEGGKALGIAAAIMNYIKGFLYSLISKKRYLVVLLFFLYELYQISKDRFVWPFMKGLKFTSVNKAIQSRSTPSPSSSSSSVDDAQQMPFTQSMKHILDDCRNELKYDPPFWAKLSSDLSTLIPTVLHKNNKPNWRRYRTGDDVDVDFLFPPSEEKNLSKLAILIPGVGGGSNAGYIVDSAETFVSAGWHVAVINARGMGESEVDTFTKVFDPSDLDVLLQTIITLCSCYAKAIAIGYSLGGIGVNKVFGMYHDRLPKNLLSGLSLSGAFRVDFMNTDRYKSVYQRFIVPDLICNLLEKYGAELLSQLGEERFNNLVNCTSYAELQKHFFSAFKEENNKDEFDVWKKKLESESESMNINRPLLLVTAHDDPLHHVEHIGIDWLDNPNVAYYVTEFGGHIGWPLKNESNSKFLWMSRLCLKYAESSLNRCQSS